MCNILHNCRLLNCSYYPTIYTLVPSQNTSSLVGTSPDSFSQTGADEVSGILGYETVYSGRTKQSTLVHTS
jgi:hypothetical protein